jgi:hypothetical protein
MKCPNCGTVLQTREEIRKEIDFLLTAQQEILNSENFGEEEIKKVKQLAKRINDNFKKL